MSHYCVVRDDLSFGLMCAYLIHAAGESSDGNIPTGTRAVALCVENEHALRELETELQAAKIKHTAVWEDDELFSIGLAPVGEGELQEIRRVTGGLSLVR